MANTAPTKRLGPSEATLRDPGAVYAADVAACEARLAQLDRASARLGNARLAVFACALALALAVWFGALPGGWLGTAGGVFLVFVGLAVWHQRVSLAEARLRLRRAYDERGLSRLGEGWHAFVNDGAAYADASHLYTPDLDVFGRGSLFQLLDETVTRDGERRLAAWLSGPASAGEVAGRQAAVQELAPLLDFRRELAVEARLRGRDKLDAAGFAAWASGADQLSRVRWARWLPGLALLTVGTWIASLYDVAPRAVPTASFTLQLVALALTRRAFATYFASVSLGDQGLWRLHDTFAQLERRVFACERLRALSRELDGARVSSVLRRLARWYGFAEARRTQLGPLLNVFLLWDAWFLFRIEAWRSRHGARVGPWLAALAELEALSSLAGLAHDRPRFTFPRVVEDAEPRLDAKGLGHPLLAAPIPNDVTLRGRGQALLVTGSNMSGKSTLLRAAGCNVVLALAGAPVCATELVISELALATSMRVKDSLERGVSYFYAEVLRLKAVLDAARAAEGRALVLLDEILLGTNTRERQIASREVVTLLLATGCIALVTTHDLSLTALADEHDGVRNVHFRDALVGDAMSFDYLLRPGVVDTTNALRVLRLAGISIGEP